MSEDKKAVQTITIHGLFTSLVEGEPLGKIPARLVISIEEATVVADDFSVVHQRAHRFRLLAGSGEQISSSGEFVPDATWGCWR
jgi:hypothetical protein